ncbi:cell wall metabolism sensor histidine kinase WalK [Amycolatopsis sp. DSM 110486]|uniref:sensor histidine kinase n=1 Tax=Amycolatopsis sp. DSM 110486 TaxID=2865832 RepID=UPI001C6A3801|nr:HAMP domain-containing sensor histidine kinase [Amycolatopsis sp. DSM 110486]QYN16582.1 HAMP domain-containing histidine kinase [Amycolatopsis sp. DSM 110486]
MKRLRRWARRWYAAWRASRLGTRLAFGLGALALVVFAIVGTVTVGFMHGYLGRRLDEQLKTSQVAQVPGLRSSHGNPEIVYSWFSAVFEVDRGVATPQPGSNLPTDITPLADVASDATRGDVFRTVYLHGDGPYRVRACPVATDSAGSGTVLLSAAPQADLDSTVRQLVLVEVIAFLIALAILVVVGRLVLRRGLQPLSDMAGTAHDIASHDLTGTANLPVRATGEGGGAEVAELRTAFNVMLTHIESSLAARTAANERLRRFVADASHELRTPLTSIRGYADLFRYAAANEPEEREAHLAKIGEETARMSVLVDDLLLLARLDAHDAEPPVRPERVDVVPIAEAAADAFRVGRPAHPLGVSLGTSAVFVDADPVRLRQIFDNLLANAAVHTPSGTRVGLSVSVLDSVAVIRVENAGPGISPEDQQRIFDRFFRVDNSRTRSAGGTGLGLSVVHSLVVEHGGTVEVTSRPGQTVFTVRLPLAG